MFLVLCRGGLRDVSKHGDAVWIPMVDIFPRAKRGQNISVQIRGVMVATDENSAFNNATQLEAVRLACSASVE
jgi:hypothetical protein